jgi:long-chain acyl-CoA synthetase
MSMDSTHPVERALHWAAVQGTAPLFTQPLPDGALRRWTWREGVDEAQRLAAVLVAQGLPPGGRVAILSKNCAWWLITDLAIWMAGGVSVPLFPTARPQELVHILQHAQVRLLVVGKLDAWTDDHEALTTRQPTLAMPCAPEPMRAARTRWDDALRDTLPLAPLRTPPLDDLATLIYTSGTTGSPKGAMHSFRNIGRAAAVGAERFPATPADRMLSYLPLAHAAERCMVEANLWHTGFQVFFVERLETFLADLQRARPTVFLSVPRLWIKFNANVLERLPQPRLARLLRLPLVGALVRRRILKALGLDAARLAFSGGSPLPPHLVGWYAALGLPLIEAYGMTENFAISHTGVPGRLAAGSVGEPLPGVACRLADDGEVLVRSPSQSQGYWEDAALSAEVFDAEGWLHTGDRGELSASGQLRITGRLRDAFKTSKAEFVWPAAIEGALVAAGGLEQCCVFGHGHAQPFALAVLDEAARQRLAAAGDTADAERALLAQGLRAHLEHLNRHVLQPHERLRFVALVPSWRIDNRMLTDTLKPRRAPIEALHQAQFAAWFDSDERVIFVPGCEQ